MLSKVITISQQKGGTGKTTLAVHLAMAFIKYHNLKVALIDTDPQGSLGKWFMIRTEKKVPNENLTFKTASLWGAQYESKTLKKDNDIVIIDTPPKIESDARPSIEASDLVIIPMTPSHVDFWATEAIIEIAKKDAGQQLAGVHGFSLPGDFVLNKLTKKNENTILEGVEGTTALNDRQRALVRQRVNAKYLPNIWDDAVDF